MMGLLYANITCMSLFLLKPYELLLSRHCLLLLYYCRLCKTDKYSGPNNTLHLECSFPNFLKTTSLQPSNFFV